MTLSNIVFTAKVGHLSDELDLYFQNKFCLKATQTKPSFTDESYINAWESYCTESVDVGVFQSLKRCYPQLNFPVENGIGKTQVYADVVLRGKTVHLNAENNLKLNHPQGLEISIYDSIAGKVPVIKVPDNQDFIQIVQCLVHKNNPIFVPLSMGALLVNGINNWDRLNAIKKNWIENNPMGNWNEAFSNEVLPNPALFKDKIIILSTKPYSNVAANSLALSEDVWKTYSYTIRLEHECTHLYTLKKYGSATNNLHDELIADYIGICKAIGYYNKKWMLTFMGLEDYPTYRKGARLENYLGSSGLSVESFERLIVIIKNAIENIALFDIELGKITSVEDQKCRIDALCQTSLLAIASENGANILVQQWRSSSLP